jgi:tetratricopeptide (TPR) repeat protein
MAALLLAAVTLALYTPVLRHELVNFDDDHYIARNPHVLGGLSPAGAAWAFTSLYGANWFPLTWLSWQADVSLWGKDPAGFHLTNILLHAAAAALLLVALARLTGSLVPSAFVAFSFALHPLHVESVAWAAARKDVLSGLFVVLALLACARHAEAPSRARLAVVALWLACALMAKPTAVVLPAVLLLLDVWPLRRHPAVLEKLPLFGLALAASAVTVVAQRGAEALQPLQAFPLRVRILNALDSYAAYLRQAFWPLDLAVYYPHPGEGVSLGGAAVGGALLLAGSAGAVWALRSRPWLAVGWFWFVGTLVPVIGLVQVGQQARADRYTYLPLIGLAIALAFEAAHASARRPGLQRPLLWASLGCLGACAVLTSRQLGTWKDSVALFSHARLVTRENAVAELNLGVALLERGQFAEAEARLREALRIHAGSAEAHAALGEALARQSRGAEAEQHLRAAVRLDARLARGHNSLGRLLLEQRKPEEAIVHFREATLLEPGYAEPWSNLGSALVAQGSLTEAIEYFAKAVALDPALVEAHNNWGVALLNRGDLDGAIARFAEAVRLEPRHANAHQNWGLALARRREFEAAAARYQEALGLRPDDAVSLGGLGLCLAHLGRFRDAIQAFEAAAALRPNDAELLTSWGMALASLGEHEAALDRYRAALALDPGYAEARNGLGMLFGGLGRTAEALREFEAAAKLKPDFAPAHNNWALALAASGRVAEAVERAREAVRLDPGYADARNNLGVFLARQGRLPEAAEQFQEALRLDPSRADARGNLERLAGARPARP